MRLEGGQPQNQLAELALESKATAARVEAARELFPEASLSDFEAVGTTGRRLRHRETGVEYMVAQDQVLLASNPHRHGVECFILSADRIWFLRPRGWTGNVETGVPGEILSGRLEAGPGRSVRLVDARSGAVVKENLRL